MSTILNVTSFLSFSDQSEETAALADLVENGANLLRSVDCLLTDIHTLSGFSGECMYIVSCVISIERCMYL